MRKTTAVAKRKAKSDGQTPEMKIEMWPIDRPQDYPKNARKWSQAAINKVTTSLREFGFRQPLVVDKHDVIIIGHLRRVAARAAGFTHVPVHVADLPAGKVRQLRLMDNRSHDEAQWDLDVLAEEMAELSKLDLDLSLTGFDKIMWGLNGEGVTPDWSGMPEFEHEDLKPDSAINVQFRNQPDREAFLSLIGEDVNRTRSIWYPHMEQLIMSRRADGPVTVPENRYPIYIISKGRADSRLTVKALERLNIDFRVVVEPQERDEYAVVIDPEKLLTLPFSNLGQGSIPARNWVWEHSMAGGASRHWILDDNLEGFYRFNRNQKVKIIDFNPFSFMEDFTERYENVALSGPNYEFFCDRRAPNKRPFYLNTRIYSCILIKNDLPFQWRGRYNEDTDLSLRVLKAGLCTIEFNAFLANKVMTMKMKGGNTDELYKGDGRLKMAQSLHAQHPDVVKVKQRWGRWQHVVDYRPFKANKFIPKPGFEVPDDSEAPGSEAVA